MPAIDALRNQDVDGALKELFDEVRNQPDQPRHRIFLFQLLCVAGQWDRALTQLNVARDLDPEAAVMAKAYQEILQCEALRRDVFAGKRSPLVFGEPEPWIAQMIEAVRLDADGQAEAADDLRAQALEAAPATPGELTFASRSDAGEATDETAPFEWVADGDARLGPLLEIIINGRYYWAPFERVAEVTLEAPSDLRDVVWMPAQFRWTNEGEAAGVIPTRYVGSESEADGGLRLARKTEWRGTTSENAYTGVGQRTLVTDRGEYGLMDLRRLTLSPAADA